MTSLGYQVTWTRLLASGTGNTTYVFTMILGVFLIGIALGAIIFNLVRSRIGDPLRFLAGAQLTVAALAFASLLWLLDNPNTFVPSRPLDTVAALVGAVILVVLPVTVVLGIAFPAASALLPDGAERAGTSSGALLGVNTTGAIVGSLVLPFVLMPLLGSPVVVALLALTNALVGIALALIAAPRATVTALSGAIVVLAIVVVSLAPGALAQPNERWIQQANGRLFASAEDEIASVQAGQVRSTPQLWVAGTSMTLLTIDAKLMPILPLMANPDAKEALIVAFGMGSSYRSALIAGLDVEAVELVPSVVDMFGYYYPDADTFAAHPNGHIVVADGRNHLELSGKDYDIIVTDPPPPIESSGASVISSHEYYEAGRDHLKPGGIMMQWAPHGTDQGEFERHLRTFASVFPRGARRARAGRLRELLPRIDDADRADRRRDPRRARAAGCRRGHLLRLRQPRDHAGGLGGVHPGPRHAVRGGCGRSCRRRPAGHRRPAAAGVLPAPAAVRLGPMTGERTPWN